MINLTQPQDIAAEYLQMLEGLHARGEHKPRPRRSRHPWYSCASLGGAVPSGKVTMVVGVDEEVRQNFMSWLAIRLGYDRNRMTLALLCRGTVDDFVRRFISLESGVPSAIIDAGLFKTFDWADITRAAGKFAAAQLRFAETSAPSMDSIRQLMSGFKKTGTRPGFMTIDSLEDTAEVRRNAKSALIVIKKLGVLAAKSGVGIVVGSKAAPMKDALKEIIGLPGVLTLSVSTAKPVGKGENPIQADAFLAPTKIVPWHKVKFSEDASVRVGQTKVDYAQSNLFSE